MLKADSIFMTQHNCFLPTMTAATGFVLLTLGCCPVTAATYSVSTKGIDTNNGAPGTPWRTLQHAADAVKPGDTVVVERGIYPEVVTFTQGGNASAWVTFRSRIRGGAKIIGGNYSTLNIRANYMIFEGFDVDANEGHGFDIEGSHHCIIKNNIAHDCGGSGISAAASEYVTVTENVCFNNSKTNPYQTSGISLYECRPLSDGKPGFHNIVSKNICYDNGESAAITGNHTDGNGIIIDDFHNEQGNFKQYPFAGKNYPYATLVENNVCYHNGAKGIQVYITDNVTVRNNTVYWNNWDNLNDGTWRGEINIQNAAGIVCTNNIAVTNPAYNPANTSLLIAATDGFNDTTTQVTHNLTFNGTVGDVSIKQDSTKATISMTGSKLGVNPYFVKPNLITPDFCLQRTSPARAAGTLYGTPTAAWDDIARRPRRRGQPVDLGAYSYDSLK